MKRSGEMSDFERLVLEHYKTNDFETLLEATVDYCERNEVDYDDLMTVIEFTPSFKNILYSEAEKINLVVKKEKNHVEIEFL